MYLRTSTVTILNATTTSPSVRGDGDQLVGVVTPAALTGVAFTFLGSVDNVNFVSVTDKAGAAISLTVAANRFVSLDPHLLSLPYFKLVSGSSEGADRVITLVWLPRIGGA